MKYLISIIVIVCAFSCTAVRAQDATSAPAIKTATAKPVVDKDKLETQEPPPEFKQKVQLMILLDGLATEDEAAAHNERARIAQLSQDLTAIQDAKQKEGFRYDQQSGKFVKISPVPNPAVK